MSRRHDHSPHDDATPTHDRHRVIERHCDVAVVGGSAAGLAAGLQLARQRRSVIVVDDDTPRNAPAAHMHGYLGHDGAAPDHLVALGRDEVRSYGGEVLTGRVVGARRRDDGRFELGVTGSHTVVARRVLLATGIADDLPAVDGVAPQWGRGVLHCPFCHGFEVRDRVVVQIVTRSFGLHPTPLLRHLTDRLTVVVHESAGVDPAHVASLASAGVTVERATAERVVTGADGEVSGVALRDGRVLPAHAVFVGGGFRARAEALAGVGLTTTPHASGAGDVVAVDPRGRTTVPGLYAAGNVTDPALQVLPAAAHGSQVGAMIAFDLADEDLAGGAWAPGDEADWNHLYAGERVWSGNPNGTLVAEAGALTPGRALDVGAGEGADALWLAERGWQVTATDISAHAVARARDEAARRGLSLDVRRSDVNAPAPFGDDTFDLVSLQYGSIKRTPDDRGLRSLLGAVAPGGTLLVVHHDTAALHAEVDPATDTRMYDMAAYVGVHDIAAALAADADAWEIEVDETRPRPPGAASGHHVDDIVLRAVRRRS